MAGKWSIKVHDRLPLHADQNGRHPSRRMSGRRANLPRDQERPVNHSSRPRDSQGATHSYAKHLYKNGGGSLVRPRPGTLHRDLRARSFRFRVDEPGPGTFRPRPLSRSRSLKFRLWPRLLKNRLEKGTWRNSFVLTLVSDRTTAMCREEASTGNISFIPNRLLSQ